MKKIITMIVVLIIIVGLGIGGYWLYKKYLNPDVSSELEKIEINPDERKELVENLTTKEEKINMIIQLIDDISNHKITYNISKIGRFYLKDKYIIDYEISCAARERDYMDNNYVTGSVIDCTMWQNNSKTVYLWRKYTNSIPEDVLALYKNDIVVDLQIEDELLLGKTSMAYTATLERGFTDELEDFKLNRNDLKLEEKNGVYTLRSNVNTIETDGISYLKNHQWHLELNNKKLYEKLILPIKNEKNFATITENDNFDTMSKYDRKQMLKDYIASVEPKDQTWTVDKVENQETWNSLYCDKEKLLLDWKLAGKLASSQSIDMNLNLELSLNKTVMTKTESAGVTTVKIIADKDDIVKTSVGTVDDFSLTMTMVVQSDMTYTCDYKATISYKSDEISFEQTFEGVESGIIKDKFVDEATLNSSIVSNVTKLIVEDANNNRYICNESKYAFSGEDSIVTLIAYYLFK